MSTQPIDPVTQARLEAGKRLGFPLDGELSYLYLAMHATSEAYHAVLSKCRTDAAILESVKSEECKASKAAHRAYWDAVSARRIAELGLDPL